MPVARPRRSLVIGVVAVLALAACSDADEPKAEPSATATSAVAAPVVPAVVTLVDAGVAPRRVVALDVEKGHSETSTLALTSTTDDDFLSSEPTTVPMAIPFTTTIVDVSDEEVVTDVVYGKATISGGGLDEASLTQARQALANLEGVTMRVVHDRTGRVVSRETDPGDKAADLVARILEDVIGLGFVLAVPLPAEEVGVGAQWKVASEIGTSGRRAKVVSTYELTELTDGGYAIEVASTQTAEPGDTPAGKIIDGISTATGVVRGKSGLLGPIRATSSSKGSTTVEVGGQRVTTTFDVALDATTR
ncbi:hypothetical protein [Nocardioides sp. WS12]|uniref:hypothetical protein n=1 Tax=Nocardioides sp. WS12 TaxID=2486272 RepID=UPI0015FE7DEF|nr:hypothetical protein [Nocardioides sp. WS12]